MQKRAPKQLSSHVVQAIFHSLCQIDIPNSKNDVPNIIVAPESVFPFSLHNGNPILSHWEYALPKNAHFLLGVTDTGGEGQSVCWIHGGRIMLTYVKRTSVDFTEKLPAMWKSFSWAQMLFRPGTIKTDSAGVNKSVSVFKISPTLWIKPIICGDLFFGQFPNIRGSVTDSKTIILPVAFVNDSWFLPYFQTILALQANVIAMLHSLPLYYVAHSGIRNF
jgi:hypothetical protein